MIQFPLSAAEFSAIIIDFQHQHGRHHLPWQVAREPYHVWISEVMLQQTQVHTVIPFFERWMTNFPTIKALHQADIEWVRSHWQGLGYYRRFNHLMQATDYLAEHFDYTLPANLKDLMDLPGIGRSTAGAILSFGFGQPAPIMDSHVVRILCRVAGFSEPVDCAASKKCLWQLATQLMPTVNPASYNQGLMDLGAAICTAKQAPLCHLCPLVDCCIAAKTSQTANLPTKRAKKKLVEQHIHFAVIQKQQQEKKLVYLQQRSEKGIWSMLWCLPEIHAPENSQAVATIQHLLTHRRLQLSLYHLPLPIDKGSWFDQDACQQLGIPQPIQQWLINSFFIKNEPSI